LLLKKISKSCGVIQLARFNWFWNSRNSARFSKNSKERESKRDSRHSRFLYWFTQQPGYVQSLTHSKDFTKMINLIKFTTLAYSKNTLHTAATTVEPTADQETTQSPLCVSRTPLLKPTASHSYTESTV